MKKIVLIHLILSCFLFKNSYCQDKEYLQDEKWKRGNIYIGILPGYEVYKKDSAKVTIALPIGSNIRIYSKTSNKYFDIDFAFMPIVLDSYKFTSYFKAGIGYGIISKSFNTELHINYSHCFLGFNNLIGIGYDLKAIEIPLTIEYFMPFPLKNNQRRYILVGFKIPNNRS